MPVLITGGAGFVGSNLAAHLADQGQSVRVLDNLSRQGVAANAEWLRRDYPSVEVICGDVRDHSRVAAAVRGVDRVYHLAGQVAVTTSVTDPRTDFEVNLLGTLNVLEAVRQHAADAQLFYTSTNKVYGGMEQVAVEQRGERYEYRDFEGVSEEMPLDFHSPYGCSKGGADQYVRDYARIYGLRTVVFRMSCIYGPHQCGNEDQGWVAHFARAALTGEPLTIFGDGRQVRDILYVGDLLRAFELAAASRIAGSVYNIGGGPENTVSLLELIRELETITDRTIPVRYVDWRPGDQRIYVTDVTRATRELDWQPHVSKREGLSRLVAWLQVALGHG